MQKNNKIQELSRKFFENRTEINFKPVFKEIENIVRSSTSSILKNDEDKIQEVVSEVAMALWSNKKNDGSEIFSEDQSMLSWVYVSSKNKAIQMFRKSSRSKETLESDLMRDGEDEETNVFETMMYRSGVSDEMNLEDDYVPFHEDLSAQHDFIMNTLSLLFSGEEYEILYKAIVEKVSPEVIAEEYGIASRVTITSRNRRARNKISSLLQEKINESRMKESMMVDGNMTYEKNDHIIICSRKNGKLNGSYEKRNKSGQIIEIGEYNVGEKVGIWKTFYQSGIVESVIDYDNEMNYELYDRFGMMESNGKFK